MPYARVFSLEDRGQRSGSGRRYYKLVSHFNDLFHFDDETPVEFVRKNLSQQPSCAQKAAFEYEGNFYLLDTFIASQPVIQRRVQECVRWYQNGKAGYVVYEQSEPAYYNYTGAPLTLFGPYPAGQIIIKPCKIVLSCEVQYAQRVKWAKLGGTDAARLNADVLGVPIYTANIVSCDPLPVSLEPYDFAIVTLAYARAYQSRFGMDSRLLVPCQAVQNAAGDLIGYRGLCHPV